MWQQCLTNWMPTSWYEQNLCIMLRQPCGPLSRYWSQESFLPLLMVKFIPETLNWSWLLLGSGSRLWKPYHQSRKSEPGGGDRTANEGKFMDQPGHWTELKPRAVLIKLVYGKPMFAHLFNSSHLFAVIHFLMTGLKTLHQKSENWFW
jgi:hypothetical protein